jgi:NAD(P)-dependent dehydrogenase (short-subunit alcohol dehydrogenase family)
MHDFTGHVVVVASISVDRGDARTLQHASYSTHLGAACALDFARHGAHVIAIDTSAQALDALALSIRAAGGQIDTIVLDPSQPGDLAQAARRCAQLTGAVHVLVNCHHDTELASVEGTADDSWARVIAFNLLGPVYATRAFLPLLRIGAASGNAAVVHISSIDGILGNPQIPAYSAAKGGLIPLTHVMAEEFAAQGIRVNCVARAMVVNRDSQQVNPMSLSLIAHTPLARPCYPDEVSAAVRFLASSQASYITGVVLPVDGGRTGITPGTRPQRPSTS